MVPKSILAIIPDHAPKRSTSYSEIRAFKQYGDIRNVTSSAVLCRKLNNIHNTSPQLYSA
ncbi:Protein of unknown function [Pyronema omphalodes CBS 100304]|uniref:Uncharacterized protein n=1 Tax=Pyronema omphalodes (strain CBS 100304) TaxID=1076935 RepID=U4KVX2_PYROM|nr:Protein of unknown function [Pyronema omphalodes CBS 100304]